MFKSLRLWIYSSPKTLFFLIISFLVPFNPAMATPQYAFSSLSSGCLHAYTSAIGYGSRYLVNKSGTITAINSEIGSGSTANFSNSLVHIRADVGGYPTTVLDTFTPSSISNGVARYVGTHNVINGTKFWVTPGQLYSTFPGCYSQSVVANDLTSDGSISIDSTVAGVSGIYYSQSTDAKTWGVGTAQDFTFQIAIEMNSTTNSTISISSYSPSDNPLILRSPYLLTAQISNPGKVTFYSYGKPIPGCKNVYAPGSTATCNWRPSVHGTANIFALLTPSDSSINPSRSSNKSFSVTSRTNNR